MVRLSVCAVLVAACAACPACPADPVGPDDGAADGSSASGDAGPVDSAAVDALGADASGADASGHDAAAYDAALTDAAMPDTSPRDAAASDASPRDAAAPDTSPRDAAAPDTFTSLTCADLAVATPTQQVAIVEADPGCVDAFVAALVADPWTYLEAFYVLIGSAAVTNALFSVVYEELRTGRFRFAADVVDDLYQNLPAAIASCQGQYRCDDWTEWILPGLYDGSMFLCPSTAGLPEAALLQALPHGDYYCTEAIAQALAPLATSDTISALLAMAAEHAQGWARRNALRVLGRFAERGEGDAAGALVLVTRADDVKATLLEILRSDLDEEVLHEVLWILDSYFHPCWEMLADAQALSLDARFTSSLRFRAAAAVSRLIYRRQGVLPTADVDYLVAALATDDSWVRAEAAFTCELLRDEQLDSGVEARLVAALEAAYAVETALHAQVYMARALDRFNGSSLHDQLFADYEAAHLGNSASGDGILVRSGLPQAELPVFVALLEGERAAYFALLGSPFDTPVPGDPNASMTLYLFATMEEYQDYMGAFVGWGANAGGLYIEAEGKLYTYQRTPEQSVYTVEQLVKHEFGHYLQSRHLFPGLWGDAGYFDQPKAWADEGMAELMAGAELDGQGGYSLTLRPEHLDRLCGVTYRDLGGLLAQRAGYDEPGTFDYPGGWSFTHYMVSERRGALLGLYGAFRDQTYALADFAAIAGVASVSALEADWHAAMDGWCASAPPGPPGPGAGDVAWSAPEPPLPSSSAVDELAEPALRLGRRPGRPQPSPPGVR